MTGDRSGSVEHLFLGTPADNMRDAAEKNRLTVPRTRALSLFDRLTIYRTPKYPRVVVDLARRYGVTKAAISIYRRGRFIGSGVWAGTKPLTPRHGEQVFDFNSDEATA